MTLDLSSLFHSTIGFDQLNRIFDDFAKSSQSNSYPPYNILKLKNNLYRLSIAIAGFSKNDITITLDESILSIQSAGKQNRPNDSYLYKGIAYRAFEKKFHLADNIKIDSAYLHSGLLDIDLIKVAPLKKKPEKINILERSPLNRK